MPTPSRDAAWAREGVTTPRTTRRAQLDKVFGYLRGLHATHLMDVGMKLGLFTRLAETPAGMQPEALAAALGLHPPYVRGWCEAACALELLDYEPTAGYRLAPYMDEILTQPDNFSYAGDQPQIDLLVARDYARYPELFRDGGTHAFQDHDNPFFLGVAEGLRLIPRIFLELVLPKLPDLRARLEAGATVLDLGCGGGHALVAFAERYPNVRCVGMDIEPASIQMAQERIRAHGLESRVSAQLVEGAHFPAEFGGAFDLVTTFLVLHELHPDLKAQIIGQCAQALRPDGRLLIFDERYPSGPAELRDPIQLSTVMAQWYELTWGNVINTREEIHALLAGQGLRVLDETSLFRFYIVTAGKA